MRVERYKASNIKEALEQVKEDLGPDAVILHTRTLDKKNYLGLDRKSTIEVIAAVDGPSENGKHWLSEVGLSGNDRGTDSSGQQHENYANDFSSSQKLRSYMNRIEESSTQKADPNSFESQLEYFTRSNKNDYTKFVDFDPTVPQKYGERRRFSPSSSVLKPSDDSRVLLFESQRQIKSLKQEMNELRGLLKKQRSKEAVEPQKDNHKKISKKVHVQVDSTFSKPQSLFSEIIKWLKERGLSQSIAKTIVNRVQHRLDRDNVRLDHRSGAEKIYHYLCQEIASLVPTIRNYSKNGTAKPKIVAITGPTGGGKTTACAKLAVQSAYVFGKRVALIFANMAPNGVSQHLASVASIAQLPLAVVQTTKELEATIASHQDKDLILIDFASDCKSDITKTSKLAKLIRAATPHETHLVLPASLKIDDATAIGKKYSQTNFDRILFSKVDETVSIGSLIEVVQKLDKPISYFSTGPIIPDDLETASGYKLANMILRG